MHHRKGIDYVLYPIERDGIGLAAMILELYGSGDHRVCGVYQMIGVIDGAPRKWVETIRSEMRKLEQMSKESGVSEMRVAGRKWRRILPDYEPFDGVKNGLRKVL